MRGKKQLQGKRSATRQVLPRYLIYCEDANAGVEYIRGIKRTLSAQIKIGPTHGEPVGLVEAAIAHKERAPRSREDQQQAYDQVFCIIDVEAPEPHAGLDRALSAARKNGIRIVSANPCFELWLFLHFELITCYRTSDQMQAQFESLGHCDYTRRGKSITYDHLRGLYDHARANAQHLRRDSAADHRHNPWTDLDVLVDQLVRDFARPGGTRL